MSIDDILNGRFEQEAREALNKMQVHAPVGYLPQICAHITLGGHSFTGVAYTASKGGDSLVSVYSCSSLLEAADKCIAIATGPEAIARRRQELTAKLQDIEAQLSALPAPAPEEPKIAEVSEAAA